MVSGQCRQYRKPRIDVYPIKQPQNALLVIHNVAVSPIVNSGKRASRTVHVPAFFAAAPLFDTCFEVGHSFGEAYRCVSDFANGLTKTARENFSITPNLNSGQ